MGFYDVKFVATDDADWAATLEILSDTDGSYYTDAANMDFTLNVTDGGSAVLSASTTAGTITRPEDYQITWRFSATQMKALTPGNTYKVGLIMTDGVGQKTQILVGSLALVDGGIA